MKHLRRILCLIAIPAFTASAAQAQANRTWVSGVGDDANPCSRTAPCKTFAGAISKTAAFGEIDALDPGGFGAVTITKSITIDGGGGTLAGVLVAGTDGIYVAAGASDVVTLRNLTIDGIGSGLNGVKLISAKALHIEHCVISNFTVNGINIVTSAGGQVFIDDTTSRDNAGNGLNVMATSVNVHVNVSNSHFSNNTNGVFSGDFSRTAVRNSDADGNAQSGFVALGSAGSATLSLADSTASNNLASGVQAGGGTGVSSVRATNVSVFSNPTGFATGTGGTISSFGNNHNAGSGTPNATISPQ